MKASERFVGGQRPRVCRGFELAGLARWGEGAQVDALPVREAFAAAVFLPISTLYT